MQERGQARFSEKHFDEVGVVGERRQDALETHALLEAAWPAPDRDERLGHAADAKALD
jgi:hypothetical protein